MAQSPLFLSVECFAYFLERFFLLLIATIFCQIYKFLTGFCQFFVNLSHFCLKVWQFFDRRLTKFCQKIAHFGQNSCHVIRIYGLKISDTFHNMSWNPIEIYPSSVSTFSQKMANKKLTKSCQKFVNASLDKRLTWFGKV